MGSIEGLDGRTGGQKSSCISTTIRAGTNVSSFSETVAPDPGALGPLWDEEAISRDGEGA